MTTNSDDNGDVYTLQELIEVHEIRDELACEALFGGEEVPNWWYCKPSDAEIVNALAKEYGKAPRCGEPLEIVVCNYTGLLGIDTWKWLYTIATCDEQIACLLASLLPERVRVK